MNSSTLRLAVGLGLNIVWCTLAAAAETAVAFRNVSFEAASAAAKAENKVVLIDFYTTWCEPCKRLDKETWTDASVGQLLGEKAVALKLDAEKEGKDLARRYKIDAYPTTLILKPDGTEMDRLVGFREPAVFKPEFVAALEGKNSLKRAREAVAAVAQPVSEAEVRARQKLARELQRSGKHQEALVEYLWLYDVGMKAVRSFDGVRTSFLTGEMGRLAKAYEPAVKELQSRRDDAKTRLAGDGSDRDAALEFAALNEALEEQELTMEVYKQLAPGDPRRGVLGFRLYLYLAQRGRYADAVGVRPYADMVKALEAPRPNLSRMPAALQASLRQNSARSALMDAEVLAGAGRLDEAKDMVQRALAIDASAEMKEWAVGCLTRAGHPELATAPEVKNEGKSL
jgi:thiol-disulfide isomerase/thioredoxin